MSACGATLRYDAFLSVGPVDTARLTITRSISNYRIADTDVLTAFFVDPDCWQDRRLHPGHYD